MKGYVTSEPVPAVPQQRVTLEMSIEEFALLHAVLYSSLDGHSEARVALQDGIHEVIACLHPHWRRKVVEAREVTRPYATKVQSLFVSGSDS